jgi:hypothetical protein
LDRALRRLTKYCGAIEESGAKEFKRKRNAFHKRLHDGKILQNRRHQKFPQAEK